MKRWSIFGLATALLSLLVATACIPTPPPDDPDDPNGTTVGGIAPAENSADFSDHWSCQDVATGETRVYRGYREDGITPENGPDYDVAITFGRHSEPAADGTDLLFHRFWTVATSIYNPPVWAPDTNLYAWMRGDDGGAWYVGYSVGDGTFRLFEQAELVFPGGQTPSAGDTWGEYERVVGFPDPVEETTWSHRLEATNVTVVTAMGTFADCLEIYNQKESRIEYWSCTGGGLVAWRAVLDEQATHLGRWNKLTTITTEPNWHATYEFDSN